MNKNVLRCVVIESTPDGGRIPHSKSIPFCEIVSLSKDPDTDFALVQVSENLATYYERDYGKGFIVRSCPDYFHEAVQLFDEWKNEGKKDGS